MANNWKKIIKGETDNYRHQLLLNVEYAELSSYANPNIIKHT